MRWLIGLVVFLLRDFVIGWYFALYDVCDSILDVAVFVIIVDCFFVDCILLFVDYDNVLIVFVA